MDLKWLLFCCAACIASTLPSCESDSVIVVSKRYMNNSYTCFARHTKDGIEYHLTYNVCFSGMTSQTSNETGSIQCLYYECTIGSLELLDTDGKLRCFRYAYDPPSVHQPLFDRVVALHRRWPITRHAVTTRLSRTKRDFSWVSFLEKFSFMGRHQSTVSKQNEAYFHYNFMNNKPSAGGGNPSGGEAGVSRPVETPSDAPALIPVASLPSDQL